MGKKYPWAKRHFRQLPDTVLEKVAKLPSDEVVVACVKKIPASLIKHYRHVGLKLADGKLLFDAAVVPDSEVGRYSHWNVEGHEVVHRDLPKVEKVFTFETPNFGDWSKGSHDVEHVRQVYQRDFIPPYDLELNVAILQEEPGDEHVFVVKFSLGRTFKRTSKGFKDDLFFAMNLLQENVGASDVYAADANADDYLKTVYINWDILPPGQRDATLAQILSRMNSPRGHAREKLIDRYTLLNKLKPTNWVVGGNGFRRYFGAMFGGDIVVFENLDYGNAIYVMYERWQELSKRSRLELLSGNRSGFDRIPHRGHWEITLEELITQKRDKGKAA